MASGDAVRMSLQSALHGTFVSMFVITLIIIPVCLFVPKQMTHGQEAAEAEAAR